MIRTVTAVFSASGLNGYHKTEIVLLLLGSGTVVVVVVVEAE